MNTLDVLMNRLTKILNYPYRGNVELGMPVNENKVRPLFRQVKKGVSSGYDKIPWWVFKYCSNEMSSIFTEIFNESIDQCMIPSAWKHAITAPIPKVPKPTSVQDYRPIDLASIGFNCMQKTLLPYT